MKIIHVIPTLGGGGAERFVVDLLNELAKTEEVYLCTLYDLEPGKYDFFLKDLSENVQLISLSKKLGLDFSIYSKIHKILKEIKPDIVNTHLSGINYILPFTIYYKNIIFFHTIHSDAQFEIKHSLELKTRKWVYRKKLVYPITISNQSQESFRKLYQLKVDSLIYNGREMSVPSDHFDEVKREIDAFKATDETKILLHIGRFTSVKRQVFLAKVVDRLIKEKYNLSLVFVGDYQTEEGIEIANKIRALNNPSIHFLGLKNNVVDYLICADALCISSDNEGLPISFIEALSIGCVLISTPVGGLIDFINKENGFLSSDLSEESYYQAIKSFLSANDLELRSEKNRILYRENFNIESTAMSYINLYESKK